MNENEEKIINPDNSDNKDGIISDACAAEVGISENASAAPPAADAAGTPSVEPTSTDETAEQSAEACEEIQAIADGAGTAAEQPSGGACCDDEPAAQADFTKTEISDADMRRIAADPMFVGFAKGKTQDFTSLCRDFCEMLQAGEGAFTRSNLDSAILMRVTPRTDGTVTAGVALTERQRMLAREAGMSYREYYDLICGIPEKKYK